jgi:hypothetical protein
MGRTGAGIVASPKITGDSFGTNAEGTVQLRVRAGPAVLDHDRGGHVGRIS